MVDHSFRTSVSDEIEVVGEKNLNPEFLTLKRDFEQANCPLLEDKVYKFEFRKFDKQFESYYGKTAKVRYFVRVTIKRKLGSNVVREQDLAVLCSTPPPEGSQAIKMEVGIEDCLHIVFDYSRDTYHLKDCIFGKVKFAIVKIRIKNMEMCIVKRETVGSGTNAKTDNDTIVKYEIMDGSPVREEIIPIRLYLNGYDLTPSYQTVNNRFSVKYFLNLVLIDEDDRRYFKQSEIKLYRKSVTSKAKKE